MAARIYATPRARQVGAGMINGGSFVSPDFCQCTRRSSHLPRKDGTFSSRFMAHGGRFVRTVCDNCHAGQVN